MAEGGVREVVEEAQKVTEYVYYEILNAVMAGQLALFSTMLAEIALLQRLHQLAKLLINTQEVPKAAQAVREEYAKTLEMLARVYESRAKIVRSEAEFWMRLQV